MTSSTTTYNSKLQQSKDKWILENLDFVSRILSSMTVVMPDQDGRDNLHSAGVLGLVEAANAFDPRQNIPFRTFAYPRIRGAIVDEIRRQIPVSQKMQRQIAAIKRAYEVLEPPVATETLAAECNLTHEQVLDSLEAMRFVQPDGWNDLSDVIHATWRQTASDDDPLEMEEVRQALAEAIANLPDNERLVISLYYHDELNLSEIGSVLDLSESRVSRILTAARFRLQERLRCKA